MNMSPLVLLDKNVSSLFRNTLKHVKKFNATREIQYFSLIIYYFKLGSNFSHNICQRSV